MEYSFYSASFVFYAYNLLKKYMLSSVQAFVTFVLSVT